MQHGGHVDVLRLVEQRGCLVQRRLRGIEFTFLDQASREVDVPGRESRGVPALLCEALPRLDGIHRLVVGAEVLVQHPEVLEAHFLQVGVVDLARDAQFLLQVQQGGGIAAEGDPALSERAETGGDQTAVPRGDRQRVRAAVVLHGVFVPSERVELRAHVAEGACQSPAVADAFEDRPRLLEARERALGILDTE